ncbi:MAG: two-component system response regulator BtsR [Paludibacterium sp.]|uniref:two-component system response regulator BtsR n=1 Tax=Paludibacterium sp. TaxID=1917523 RepID=UPI0025E40E98|nr:two-component system response regulator BtsR [Paludibacterium sp.]MBV8046709.1 two-component system response regulator BtsR [Paludibacterium sp.]MBV8647962.1 two-component system response regulator BtsR [Paludibacterium sp.]
MNVLIVDDEPLAREELRARLSTEADMTIIGECGNAIEAIAAIHRQKPDVVFLDIQMPRISGLEMLGMLDPEHTPHIVFLTAYEDYALKAFEENAFDYLLKPAEPARLAKTLERLRRTLGARQPLSQLAPGQALSYVPCQGAGRILLLKLPDIEYVSSRVSGVYVVDHAGSEHFTELTLRTLEEKSPLVRCHRQYLVNLDAVAEIRLGEGGAADIVARNGHVIPVSRRFLKPLKQRVGIAE